MHLRTIVAAALLLGSIRPTAAHAQDATAEAAKAEARALANEGRALLAAGKYEQAIQKLLEAERLVPAPTIRLIRAQAYEKLGRLVEARDVYQGIADEKLPLDAPPQFVGAQKAAREALPEISARIPTLRIDVQAASAARVSVAVDGKAIPTPPNSPPGPDQPPGALVASTGAVPAAPGPNRTVVVGGIAASATLAAAGLVLTAAAVGTAASRDELCGRACGSREDARRWSELEDRRVALSYGATWSFIGAGLLGAATAGYALWPRPAPRGAAAAPIRVAVRGSHLVVTGGW